jgi:hypothetical protein
VARTLALIVAITAFLVPGLDGPANAATPDHYNPRPGVTFNNPLGNRAHQRAIFNKIIRSINSSPRGSDIRIFTWNYLTSDGTDALLRAQRRGVRIEVLMDASNNTEIPNQPFRRLRAGLHNFNAHVKKDRHSWARTCRHSCRGTGGVAHSKFYLFSQVGSVPRVVMLGSANFTKASTANQWNDITTHVRSKAIWGFANKIFDQASHDRPVRPPFAARAFGNVRLMFFPKGGAPDPVMRLLNQVKCHDAANTRSHRTRLRIAPDVIRTGRGLALARKVRSLWNNGCDIRIGYTVMGMDAGQVLRNPAGRGPVPMKHLVQDFNGDGEFDNYFHLKAMSIVGNVGKDRSNYVVLNGSANWSSLAGTSDENIGIYWSRSRTLRYQEHLNYWYTHFPKSRPATTTTPATLADRSARQAGPDQLVFGVGKHAVYEDGTPYSTTGVNPYAHVEN